MKSARTEVYFLGWTASGAAHKNKILENKIKASIEKNINIT